jgi:hypothetical protein
MLYGVLGIYGIVPARMGSSSTSCVRKRNLFFFQKVSKLLERIRLEMWFDGEN